MRESAMTNCVDKRDVTRRGLAVSREASSFGSENNLEPAGHKRVQ